MQSPRRNYSDRSQKTWVYIACAKVVGDNAFVASGLIAAAVSDANTHGKVHHPRYGFEAAARFHPAWGYRAASCERTRLARYQGEGTAEAPVPVREQGTHLQTAENSGKQGRRVIDVCFRHEGLASLPAVGWFRIYEQLQGLCQELDCYRLDVLSQPTPRLTGLIGVR